MDRRSLGLFVALIACTSHREAPTSGTTIAPLSARDVLRAIPGVAARLDEGRALLPAADGFRVAARAGRWGSFGDLDVTLPATSRGALRVARAAVDGAWVSVVDLDAREQKAHVDATSLVFSGAAADTDVVHVLAHEKTEELRLLRSPRAPSTTRYRLAHGSAIASFRVVGSRIEALDTKGGVVLATEPAWAVDVKGNKRDVRLALDGDVLTTSVDTTGLHYPIAIDPAWAAGPTETTPARVDFAVRSDSNYTYVIGGSSDGSNTLSTAAYFDKSSWRPMPGLNVPRRGAHAFWLYPTDGLPPVLIVAGGRNGTTYLSSIEYWKTGDSAWTLSSTALTEPRVRAAVYPLSATGGGFKTWLLAGGFNGTNSVPSMETLEMTAGVLIRTNGALLSTPREGAAIVPNGGLFMIVGGRNGTTTLSTAEQGTSAAPTSTWSAAAPLLAPRAEMFAFGYTVLAGLNGTTPLSTSEYFDTTSGTWKAGPSMATPRAWPIVGGVGFGGGGSNPNIVFGGGWNGTSVLSSSEVIAVDGSSGLLKGAFRDAGPMPGPRMLGGTAYISDTSFIAFGGASGGTPSAPTVTSTIAKYAVVGQGQACSDNLQCMTGFCVDGVCCESACTGQCSSCAVSSMQGYCQPISGAPVGGRAACTGVGAGTVCGPVCNGSDKTACHYVGNPVCGSNSCTGGVETKVSTCDGAGTCSDVPRSCGAYACGTTACKTTCAGDADCSAGHYCSGTSCVPKPGLGSPCSSTVPCGTGLFCVDSVCCNTPCTGQCQSCAIAGSIGTCTPVKGDPIGGRTACSTGGTDLCKARVCDGVDGNSCAGYKFDATKVCGASTCSGDKFVAESKCDGAGGCVAPASTDCAGGFVCSGTACKTKCTTSTDCVAGLHCKGGFCVPLDDPGTPCSSGVTCKSGFCADSVCCDKPCNGQCESCAEIGKAGTCTVISGEPRGARTACDNGGADVCKARKCDGTDGAKCAGYASDTTKTCAEPKCDGANAVGEAKCDGKGECVAPAAKSCAPYVCEGKTCRADCATAEDCAPGNDCVGGSCVPGTGAKCDDTGLVSIGKDGSRKECKPYRCLGNGLCDDKCATSGDCQTGFVCDTATKLCTEQAAPATEDDGGCAMGRSSSRSIFALAIALAAIGLARRRIRPSP